MQYLDEKQQKNALKYPLKLKKIHENISTKGAIKSIAPFNLLIHRKLNILIFQQ